MSIGGSELLPLPPPTDTAILTAGYLWSSGDVDVTAALVAVDTGQIQHHLKSDCLVTHLHLDLEYWTFLVF